MKKVFLIILLFPIGTATWCQESLGAAARRLRGEKKVEAMSSLPDPAKVSLAEYAQRAKEARRPEADSSWMHNALANQSRRQSGLSIPGYNSLLQNYPDYHSLGKAVLKEVGLDLPFPGRDLWERELYVQQQVVFQFAKTAQVFQSSSSMLNQQVGNLFSAGSVNDQVRTLLALAEDGRSRARSANPR